MSGFAKQPRVGDWATSANSRTSPDHDRLGTRFTPISLKVIS